MSTRQRPKVLLHLEYVTAHQGIVRGWCGRPKDNTDEGPYNQVECPETKVKWPTNEMEQNRSKGSYKY